MNKKKEKYWLAIIDAILAIILGILLILFGFRSCIGCSHPVADVPDRFEVTDPNDDVRYPPAEAVVVEDTTVVDDAVRQAEQVGATGDLKVTLLWDFPGDIDLHVIQPNRREIYYQHKRDNSTGGYLDVDNTAGGRGSAENVYWENPPAGNYKVYLHYYQPSSANHQTGSGECTVVIFRKGNEPQTLKVQMSRVGQKADVANFTIN